MSYTVIDSPHSVFSHITDPFTISEKLARCNAISMPRSTISFTSTSSLTNVPRSHSSVPTRTNCVVQGMDTSGTQPHSRSPSPSEPFTGITLPPALPPTTKPLTSDTTNGTAGSSSADESDQSAVTRLSKSLVEDTLFRNPHTLPPPKKLKRKPAPIFIPPQVSGRYLPASLYIHTHAQLFVFFTLSIGITLVVSHKS